MPEHIESVECGCWGCIEKQKSRALEADRVLGFARIVLDIEILPWQEKSFRAWWTKWGGANEPGN